MTDQGALKPSFTFKDYIKEEEKAIEPTIEEKILADGAEGAFWKTLKGFFEESITEIENINEAAIAQGMPFDEIGRNALVISQVKGILKKVVNKVEDAKDAREQQGTGK